MVKIGVLGFVLTLISHMNQRIEASTVQVTSKERLKFLLVKLDQVANGSAKFVKQFLGLVAISQARHGSVPCSQQHTSCHDTCNSHANNTAPSPFYCP